MWSKESKIWRVLSGVSFSISAIVLGLGLDKMFVYNNGEYYPYEYQNAYVGGDAYNYIINGNYATGFFVLATMFALLGLGFIIIYYLSKICNEENKIFSLNQMKVNEKDFQIATDTTTKHIDDENCNIDSTIECENGAQSDSTHIKDET